MSVTSNYLRVLEEINNSAVKYGRDPRDIKLVVVTKNVDWSKVLPIYQLGHRDFGENKIQEFLEKTTQAPDDCLWHFIGTLQKNKVSKAIGEFTLIHSVDSLELAKKISICSSEAGITTHVLLQANTSGEQSKHGQTPQQWEASFDELLTLPSLSIDGLMTMAPITNDHQVISSCFASLRKLRDTLSSRSGAKAKLHHLSMGMSQDFPLAIAEGATLLRIGSSIFK